VPGPAGPDGSNGTNGTNGTNIQTVTTASFIQPAVGSTVSTTFLNTSQLSTNQYIVIATGGYYLLTAISSPGSVTIKNIGSLVNASSGTTISSNSAVNPTGAPGVTGPTGVSTLDDISPTTTKGDLIVDNGSNNPDASDVRLGVGTDGQVLAADSSQATGLGYKTIAPNSVANSGDIAVFSSTTGKPAPVGDSLVFISATGALQNLAGSPNARGTSAVDLQPVRAASTDVASGANSTIGGGQSNKASGSNSVVAGGTTNIASNTNAVVAGGTTNTASGVSSAITGGNGNTASNQGAFSAGESNTSSGIDSDTTGNSNTASASYSTAKGLQASAILYAQNARASGNFSVPGDAQVSEVVMRNTTVAGTTPVLLFLDGSSTKLVVPNNKSWAVTGTIISRVPNGVATYGGQSAMWTFTAAIKNINGTVTTIPASTTFTVTRIYDDGAAAGSAAAVSAGSSNDLQIQVTGTASAIVNWVCKCSIVEVQI
jgi:hypothetical protein